MSLRKIPGVKHYRSLTEGLKIFGTSAGVAGATLDAANKAAGNANAVGDATYAASSTTVRAGWANEARSGAMVSVTTPHWRDSRDAVLLRVVASMAIDSLSKGMVVYTRKDGSTRMATKAQASNWSRGY